MASTTPIDSEERLAQAIHYWRNFTFNKNFLKLQDAVDSLQTEDRLISGLRQYAARWLLVKRGTKERAIFHSVGMWRWNSPLETGNFVPSGQSAPERLAEERIQSTANYRCQLSYGLDTASDKSLWEAQKARQVFEFEYCMLLTAFIKAFEDFIRTEKGFNVHGKERRKWQSGDDGNDSIRPKEARIKYPLHPWIAEATGKDSEFFANPDRPKMLDVGPPGQPELIDVKQTSSPYMKVGDLVWFSFIVEFFIGSNYWITNAIPLEFVRVGRLSPELLASVRGVQVGEEELAPLDRLGVGQKFELPTDFPMFGAPDTKAVHPVHADGEQSVHADGFKHDASVDEADAPNEVRFGPDDADTCRSMRDCEIARSAESMRQSMQNRSALEADGDKDGPEGDGYEGEPEGEGASHPSGPAALEDVDINDFLHLEAVEECVYDVRAAGGTDGDEDDDEDDDIVERGSSATLEDMDVSDLTPPPPSPAQGRVKPPARTGSMSTDPAVGTPFPNPTAVDTTGSPVNSPVQHSASAVSSGSRVGGLSSTRTKSSLTGASPQKVQNRKRPASTERPAHADDEGERRVLRDRRNIAKARVPHI